jgi:hypothetical protein
LLIFVEYPNYIFEEKAIIENLNQTLLAWFISKLYPSDSPSIQDGQPY